MSGPKVVRIVTIEEVRAICAGHLARLDATIARWEALGRRNDALSDQDLKFMQERRAEFDAMMAASRYLDVQKRAPEEIAFLESDIERRVAAATRRLADERAKTRRRAALAADLAGNSSLPADVRDVLRGIAEGHVTNAAAIEATFALALRSLPIHSTLSQAAVESARRLGEGLEGAKFDAWLAAQPENDERADVIDAGIAELMVIGAVKDAAALETRYSALSAETPSPSRRMRIDSLSLEIGRVLSASHARKRIIESFETVMAEARTVLVASHPIFERSALGSDSPEAAFTARAAELRGAIAEHHKVFAATTRRNAVLAALAEAGYEARETLETATPTSGRMVLRRAAHPEMGLEISGGTASQRLQMRPVRITAPGTTSEASRDRDIETIWCGDFDRLRDSLAGLEAELVIERAVPVGVTPVLAIEQIPAEQARATTAPLRTRERP